MAASLLLIFLTGCGPRLDSDDPKERKAAVEKLTDQAVLAKVALEDSAFFVRATAANKLTDPALLARVGGRAGDAYSYDIAYARAVIALSDSDPAIKVLARDLSHCDRDIPVAAARIKLALQSNCISNRIPGIVFEGEIYKLSQTYFSYREIEVRGQGARFLLSRGGKVLAEKRWETGFPLQISGIHAVPIAVKAEELLTELFRLPMFTPDDVLELSRSEIPEVRFAAAANCRDQTLLMNIAIEDKVWEVRKAAVEKLTDQTVLAKVAGEDKYGWRGTAENQNWDVRKAAVDKLTDQELLTKLALNHENTFAVGKLTDQGLLAKIALEDKNAYFRRAAVEKLTDQTVLAKVAGGENVESFVRTAAIEKLTDKSLLAELAAGARLGVPSAVREAAEVRLRTLGAQN